MFEQKVSNMAWSRFAAFAFAIFAVTPALLLYRPASPVNTATIEKDGFKWLKLDDGAYIRCRRQIETRSKAILRSHQGRMCR
jgi:hypothetical protein